MTLKEIEELERKYLNKFYYFLKYAEDELLKGFQTKNQIKDDWINYWNTEGHSDFDVGAERIVYALFNGKGIGQPNSSPVGADLFFETDNAYIHIDMKTVEATGNAGDYYPSIFVGENQNSYKATIEKQNNKSEEYNPSLPTFYNQGKSTEKICLTYFVTILYEKEDIKILNINLLSMPNGALVSHYKNRPLRAGKNRGKARFNYGNIDRFEVLSNKGNDEIDVQNSRIRIVYMDIDGCLAYKNQLKKLVDLYTHQEQLFI